MRRRTVLAAGVATALAGCVRVPRRSPPTSDELLQEALETRTGLSDLSAVRTTTVETPTETVERTARIAQRPPAERRIEVVDSNDPAAPMGTVSVRSRSASWEFDPARGEVTHVHHPNRLLADRTRLVLESLLEDEEYDLADAAADDVGDRRAHRVAATPRTDEDVRSIAVLVGDTEYVLPLESIDEDDLEAADVTRTVWIDDEHRYPVKERNVVTVDNELLHGITFTLADLAIDEGLPDDTFTYEPPEGAEVEERGIEPEGSYDSLAAAADVVPYDLPAPEVPSPYELDRVTVVEGSDHTLTTIWYVDPEFTERELYVAVSDERRFDADALEETDLDGHEAYVRDGRLESLFWTCEGLSYEVTSPMDDEPIREVASSIGCPATRRRTFALPSRARSALGSTPLLSPAPGAAAHVR